MPQMYGAAIIGAGVIFSNHARAYTKLSNRVRMIGLADVDGSRAKSASEQFFIPHHTTDYRSLLERDDVDVVSICTPPCLHEEMVVAALEAGKYVVCEKPLAHNLAACDRILEAAERHPGKLSTVYQLRYSNEAKRAVWCRDEGILGNLYFAQFSRMGTIAPQQKKNGWWGKWDVAGGGAVMTQCIHELDLLIYLMGVPSRVTASIATLGHEIESEDTFSATIEFDTGALATCYCSLAGNAPPSVQWDVVGQHATVHFPFKLISRDSRLVQQASADLGREFPSGPKPSRLPKIAAKVTNKIKRKLSRRAVAAVPSQHTDYIKAVLDAIDADQPLPIGPEQGRASVELCAAIYTSALTNQPVELPLQVDSPYHEGVTTRDYNGGVVQQPAVPEFA